MEGFLIILVMIVIIEFIAIIKLKKYLNKKEIDLNLQKYSKIENEKIIFENGKKVAQDYAQQVYYGLGYDRGYAQGQEDALNALKK